MKKSMSTLGLAQKEVDRFATRLREIRDRLNIEVDRETEGIREDLNAVGNLSSTPNHPGDTAPSQLDAGITIMENEREILQLTHDAIERIEGGSFGKCVDCGNAIQRERLEELPFTPYCFDCASRIEFEAKASSMPRLEGLEWQV
jgi:DnaK suppressor protein